LQRLERGLGNPLEGERVPAPLPLAEPTDTAARRPAGTSQLARERLSDFLSERPVRGVLLSEAGDGLLLRGGSLRVGDPLADTGWTLLEVDANGAVFASGASRQRVDLPPPRRGGAPHAVIRAFSHEDIER
jgi:hypothetical protein